MCYLVAKKFSDKGCLAVETKADKALASLVSYLGLRTLDKGIQILTVSNPDIYGEYKPYNFVSSEKEFIDKVLDIEVPDEAITKRMSGRRVCSKCANSYHVEYKKPKVEGVCDACGGELIQRKDDAPETVLARLAEYHQMTEPLKDFYKKLGKLTVVEGQEEVADTTALVYAALED